MKASSKRAAVCCCVPDANMAPVRNQVLNVRYDSATRLRLAEPAQSAQSSENLPPDFICDDTLKLYYAGDFCSQRPPGVEAAALSAV